MPPTAGPAPEPADRVAEGDPAGGSGASAAPLRRRFLRAFLRALTDEGTYDVRGNPSLWLGFVMALPIPVLEIASEGPAWLLIPSLVAPLFWAVVLGAAGRVGILAHREKEALEEEVTRARSEKEAVRATYAKALDQEASRRQALEEREEHVISELKLAEAVHRTLVPEPIAHPAVEVAVRQIPSAFVGGDYLYATVADDRWLYLAVMDVSGHGVAAALVVARIHGMVRRLTLQRHEPLSILQRLNRAAVRILRHTYYYMTIGIFRLDLSSGALLYATAGHPPQVLLRRDGRLELLHTPNRIMGIDHDVFDAERPSDATQMEAGDVLVLFTDGLFEIKGDANGEMLGEEGLHRRIARLRDLSPALLAGEVLQDLSDYGGRSTFEDDLSLLVALYRGPAVPVAQPSEAEEEAE